jgi:hypothetical protein
MGPHRHHDGNHWSARGVPLAGKKLSFVLVAGIWSNTYSNNSKLEFAKRSHLSKPLLFSRCSNSMQYHILRIVKIDFLAREHLNKPLLFCRCSNSKPKWICFVNWLRLLLSFYPCLQIVIFEGGLRPPFLLTTKVVLLYELAPASPVIASSFRLSRKT